MPGLEELEPQNRAIVELVLDKGQSYEQIAATLHLPEERVRALARQALGQLRGGDGGGGGGGSGGGGQEGAASLIPLFALYLVLIVAGLAYFIVIGLTHH